MPFVSAPRVVLGPLTPQAQASAPCLVQVLVLTHEKSLGSLWLRGKLPVVIACIPVLVAAIGALVAARGAPGAFGASSLAFALRALPRP